MRSLSIGFLAGMLLAACGQEGDGALDRPDPLHEQAIRLSAPDPGRPVRPEPPPSKDPEEPVKWEFIREGIFPCSRCHIGGADFPDTRPAMPHQLHLDRDLECVDCHVPEGGSANPRVPAPEVCHDCHEDLAEESAPVRAYFEAVRAKDGSFTLPRRWRTPDATFDHKRHSEARITCAECHGEPSNQPFRKPKPVALMQRCIDCHEERSAPAECKTCHEADYQPQHGVVLHHAEEQRGCLDCHNPDNRDTLRLANGDAVTFERSYRLCGQCHGPKLRDWKAGLHGKRTGMWDGAKQFYLCAHCHDPHAPRFASMTPVPPPVRPEDVR